ncbi:tetratricopeptide repeat protein [Croceiramulus getboli]|nr:tetratricopeptide repeat protein [Flavobacteriaceae bacterium YJPT1-3]
MKTRFLILFAVACSTVMFAQKRELRSAEKAISSGNYAEAKASLSQAEGMMAEMDEDEKEQFYFLKGQSLLGNENKNVPQLKEAVAAFKKSSEFNDGDDYGDVAQQGIEQAVVGIINSAIEDQNSENYTAAATKLYDAYSFSKKDTVYLYYAASNAVNGKDYDTALNYYNELKNMGFKGREKIFVATVKATGEEETFPSELERDLAIKTEEYIKPETRMSPAKSAEIAKNIALIYISRNENEKALEAMADARAENPDDDILARAEADIYLKMGNTDKYEEIMQEFIAKDPNNPEIYYNLGVSAGQVGAKDKAMEYYKKALAINPDYPAANINVSAILLEEDQKLVDEMNNLGMSAADNKKYEALKKKRFDLYRSAIPYLEKAVAGAPGNKGVVQTLYNIYLQLGEQAKADEYKAKLDSMD